MYDNPYKTLRDRIYRLEHRLEELQTERDEMDLALRAAVAGAMTPAETYVAAGVFGLRELSPGDVIIHFCINKAAPSKDAESPTVHHVFHQFTIPHLRTVIISQLCIEPAVASHFYLQKVLLNHTAELLWHDCDGVPAGLFSHPIGSPRFHWRFMNNDILSIKLINTSDQIRDFHLYALGHYQPRIL